ncbi:MAG: hypothetical protein M3R35_01735 [Candidatus Eremiobacteraeota bacterium]|nr:hypothetical protein [Candidatus Eremiobacteraeota bacterium]
MWPLFVVIVVLGLFIGGVLAHFLGSPKAAPQKRTVVTPPLPIANVTPSPVEPTPRPMRTPSKPPVAAITLRPTATPKTTPTGAPTAAPSLAPTSAPTVAPTQAPTTAPVRRPPATVAPRRIEPIARKPEPPAVAPATPADTSGAVVRSYINALAGGNRDSAQQYLSSGSVDQDSFIDASAHIASLTSELNADGSRKVDVNLDTASGKYFITFTVTGGRIADHTAIKP